MDHSKVIDILRKAECLFDKYSLLDGPAIQAREAVNYVRNLYEYNQALKKEVEETESKITLLQQKLSASQKEGEVLCKSPATEQANKSNSTPFVNNSKFGKIVKFNVVAYCPHCGNDTHVSPRGLQDGYVSCQHCDENLKIVLG